MWRLARPLAAARPTALLQAARRGAAPALGAAGAAGGTGAAGAAGGAAAVARRAAGGWRAGAPAPAWGARGLATKTTVKKKAVPAKGGKDKKGKDVKKGGKDAKKASGKGSGKGGRTLAGFGAGEDGMPSNSLLNEWALKVLRGMPSLPKTPLSAEEIARHKAVATEYNRQTLFRHQRNNMFIRQRVELKNAAIKTMDPAEWAEIQKGGDMGGAIRAPPHRHMPFWTPPIVI
jgi:hypothetical protein